MSRHHITPPVIYAPPPKKIEQKKRRAPIGTLRKFGETNEARETGETGQLPPLPGKLVQQDFPEIEGADRKPRHPPGRLSEGTLKAMLEVQELK